MSVKSLRQIYQLKIELDDYQPAIWRRVLVASDMNLEEVNAVIQIAMGWQNCHLHQFTKGKERYTISEFEEDYDDMPFNDEREYKIGQVLKKPGDNIRYEYDYGDSWEHTITLEEIQEFDPKVKTPRCIAGENACPPEDCGGVWGYESFLEAIKDPDHDQHQEMIEWLGIVEFDPTKFKRGPVNIRLGRSLESFLFHNYAQ